MHKLIKLIYKECRAAWTNGSEDSSEDSWLTKEKSNGKMIIAHVARWKEKLWNIFSYFQTLNTVYTNEPDVRAVDVLLNPLLEQASEISKSGDKISHSLLIHLASSRASVREGTRNEIKNSIKNTCSTFRVGQVFE